MKTIVTSIFLIISIFAKGQSSDIIYVPNQKSLVVSYTLNYSHVGMYVGGYVRTTFPAPYIYTTPMSMINRIGVNFGGGKYNIMLGGYVESFGASVSIQPDVWLKIYPLRIITNTKEGADIVLAVNYMREFNYGVGIAIPFRGIYSRW